MASRPVALGVLAAAAAVAAAILAASGATPAAVSLGLVAAVLSVAGALSARRAVQSNLEVTAAARKISTGDLAARSALIDDAGTSGAFNEMAAVVEALVEGRGHEGARLVAALNSIGDAVVAVDLAGTVVFANTAATQAFGGSGSGLEGNPFVWMLADEQVLEALRSSREEGRREVRLIERSGKQYFQVTTAPILDGGAWAALVVFHDITDVRRVEAMRRDFVANVSHELRTPLAAVKSVIETLQSGALEDPEVARDFLDRADTEVDRLVRMVEELLELSRIESGDSPLVAVPLDIGRVVRDAAGRLRPQAEKQGLELDVDVGPDLPMVQGDAEHLERVVVNLVHNALKFTPSGGSVVVRAAAANGAVRVEVSDTGAGILPEDLTRVFERFYKADRSRESGGTGLGLAVARHTVEAHGGTIEAASKPGKGSTFAFTLPPASPARED